jgi:hypothetical protein
MDASNRPTVWQAISGSETSNHSMMGQNIVGDVMGVCVDVARVSGQIAARNAIYVANRESVAYPTGPVHDLAGSSSGVLPAESCDSVVI